MKEISRRNFMKGGASAAALLALSQTGIPVFADDSTQIDGPDRIVMTAEMEANRAERILRGHAIRMSRAAPITLSGVPRLQQSGQLWSDDVMKKDMDLIGESGCCLTSFTMIQQYYGGTDNPRQVNEKLDIYACPFEWGDAATIYNYEIVDRARNDNGFSTDYALDFCIGAIADGYPVLLGFTAPSSGSGNTHFVTVYGYTENGNDLMIRDPASANYIVASKYLNQGRSVHRMYIYRPFPSEEK